MNQASMLAIQTMLQRQKRFNEFRSNTEPPSYNEEFGM